MHTYTVIIDLAQTISCMAALFSIVLLLRFITANPDGVELRYSWTVTITILINFCTLAGIMLMKWLL